jgi:cytochrome c oxidase subunit 4
MRGEILWRPLAGWAALIALVAASAFVGTHGHRLLPVAIAAVQVAILALFFMQLLRAEGLVRLAALAGIVWASLLFLLTFADLLTR